MTPTLARIHALGLTAKRFADITGNSPVTVSYWGRVRPDNREDRPQRPVAVPAWVGLLLEAWERHPELIP
jgi:hypothetical protein